MICLKKQLTIQLEGKVVSRFFNAVKRLYYNISNRYFLLHSMHSTIQMVHVRKSILKQNITTNRGEFYSHRRSDP